ncbi:MAG: hypothetical protein V1773_17720 [bacterium]
MLNYTETSKKRTQVGQQQLLLIVLGILIVGLAIILGIQLFSSNAITTKRDNLISECMNLSTLAQQYYSRPLAMGGGGRSFAGWQIPAELRVTSNGRYEITENSAPATSIEITAIGNEEVTAGDSVSVKVEILARSFQVTILN